MAKNITITRMVFVAIIIVIFIGIYCFKHQKEDTKIAHFQGVDVSHYQGDIDWQQVKDSGVKFVYVKVSEGMNEIDPKFPFNWLETQKVDLLRGGYHFFEPEEDVDQQVQSFIKALKSHGRETEGMLPPALDVEVVRNASKTQLKAGIKKWLGLVEDELGCRPIIYTNRGFWDQELNDEFANYPLWIAYYGRELELPKGWKNQVFWQYEQNAKVLGIKGNVDKNRFTGTQTEFENLVCKGKKLTPKL